jgi:hypothetical protein
MKKVFFCAIALVAFSTTSFALNNDKSEKKKNVVVENKVIAVGTYMCTLTTCDDNGCCYQQTATSKVSQKDACAKAAKEPTVLIN